jgi:diguanylate cyclase (GGDEF)-like protein
MLARPLASYLAHGVASKMQRRVALGTTLGLLVVAVGAIPFGRYQLGKPDALLPAVTSAAFVAMLVTAARLRNQYLTTRYAPLAVLANAYGVTALLSIPYMLSFPHVFSADGFGLGAQAAPWFWVTWHAFFVLLLAGYVWSDSYFSRKAIDVLAASEIVRRYYVCVVAAAMATVYCVVNWHDSLPVLVLDGQYTPTYHLLVDQLLLASSCVVLATLVARTALRHSTNLWLAVVLTTFAIEIYLNGEVVNARFSVAWYMGFLEAAVWQTIFLFVQLHDSNQQLAAIAKDTISLHEETQRDALTSVFNRRGYDDRYALAFAESAASGVSVALLALDLDYFKRFNDHFGHLAGDEALRSMAAAMTGVVNRPADAVCRMGGDEFVVVLSSTDERGASIVAERIRSSVSRLRIRNAPDVPIPAMSVSIGIAVALPGEPESAQAMYERADKALYRAKHFGRNRVVSSGDMRGGEINLRIV